MIRFALASILAIAAALAVDILGRRRGLDPPGFRSPLRRALATLILTFTFLLAVFLPAIYFDVGPAVDYESLSPGVAMQLQALFLLTLAAWVALGYSGVAPAGGPPTPGDPDPWPPRVRWQRLVGLECRRPLQEIRLGLVAGLGAWLAVLMVAMLFAGLLTLLGGEALVGEAPPEAIVWLAGLPVGWRLLISLAAGVVEEVFFRGFLQRRIGIALSTVLFVGAHLGYGQPFMLIGLTLLSFFYASLVRWRGNVWAAATAHFLFDAVQLLVVIPAALELSQTPPAFLAALGFC